MLSTVIVLQHAPYETSGLIGEALEARGVATRVVHAYAGDPVPESLDGAVGLVALGGAYGVYEAAEYPFLRDEMLLIERALGDDRPVLAVCLGSQLLASVLGAEISRAPAKEIGFNPVTLSDDALSDPLWSDLGRTLQTFHWHGDTFSLPAGAVALASSAMTANQAFRYGDRA